MFVAAANAGAKKIMLPADSKENYEKLGRDLKQEIEVIFYSTPLDAAKKALSVAVYNHYKRILSGKNLGIDIRPDLVVLNRTKMPAVLVEAGFIDSDKDNQIFDSRFKEMAEAIASGIEDALEEQHDAMRPVYTIQVGAFRNKIYADNLLLRLKRQGYPAYLDYANNLYRVRVGQYEQLDQAVDLEQRLKNRGYTTFLTTR